MRTSRSACWAALAGLACLIGAGSASGAPPRAFDGPGLSADAVNWSPWQGRVNYGSALPLWRSGLGGFESGGFAVKRIPSLTRLDLLGDYFFAPSLASSSGIGGFRATSGIIIGTRSQLSISQSSLPDGLFGTSNRLLRSSALPYSADAGVEPATSPYVGVGYTGPAEPGGWSFSADLGLIGSGANNAASRLFGSGQRNLDDSSRDMRLTPLLQIGVLYSF